MGKWLLTKKMFTLVRFGVADMIFVPAAHRQCARDASTLSPNDGK